MIFSKRPNLLIPVGAGEFRAWPGAMPIASVISPPKDRRSSGITPVSPYILAVIDMQPAFVQLNQKPVAAVERLIVQAQADHAETVFVEYGTASPTYNVLTRHCDGDLAERTVYKSSTSGAEAIINFCVARSLPMKRVLVCGVEWDCCVQASLWNLCELLPDSTIELVTQATNAPSEYDWADYQYLCAAERGFLRKPQPANLILSAWLNHAA